VKVAFVHYWLVGMRGGEAVLEEFCTLFPDADIYTHVYDESSVSKKISAHNIYTTSISKLPFSKKFYQLSLPFMPIALEQIDLSDYDLVISFESGPSKGVIVAPEAQHVCYCHSPMRYLWDMYHEYLSRTGWLKRLLMIPVIHYLRMWDVTSSSRVDFYLANSSFVKARIRKYYRRDAIVINPPVDLERFSRRDGFGDSEDYYLFVGQLVDYKRADLAVDAFNENGKKLVIIGTGERSSMLKKRVKSNIEILGRVNNVDLIRHYSQCKALVFPGVEDFGIVPLEAMACGKPVIAYKRGGAVDTVVDGVTGLFFAEQTPKALNDAIERFEAIEAEFQPDHIAKHASQFSANTFRKSIATFLSENVCLDL
jgi:glycosyltransferase involved in cell wall biosynthesis